MRAWSDAGTIGGALQSNSNNFDLLRLLAAITVVASHSYPLLGHGDEIFSRFQNYDSGGGFAVAVFFVISGFLITRSANNNSALDFLIGRIFRLIPALIFLSMIEFLIIGPALTTMTIYDYIIREYLFIFKNISIFLAQYNLADLFESHPVRAINGSLWTLPFEVFNYILILFLIKINFINKENIRNICIFTVGLFVITQVLYGLSFQEQFGFLVKNAPFFTGIKLTVFFLFGAYLYLQGEKIPLSWPLCIISLLMLVISDGTKFGLVAYPLCFSYVVIFLAFATPPINIKSKIGDLSYGIFIYGFMCQQLGIEIFKINNPTLLTICALMMAIIFSLVSWHVVEKPSQHFANALRASLRKQAEQSHINTGL